MPSPSPHTPAAEAPRPRGRPRKTAEERDDGNRRQALLGAAALLFRQQGFAATSTRDIAQAVGMRSGSPFYHFDSKQALLGAVMTEGMRSALQHQAQALAALPAGASARERFAALVRSHFDVLLGPQSDFIPVMLYEWRLLQPEQRAAVQAHLRRLFSNNRIAVTAPERKNGSTELKVGDEFIGTVHRDAEDGDVSYAVQIVVLSEDLDVPN